MSKLIDYCIEKALETPARRQRQRHYCVITDKRGRIISEAANSYITTHPLMKRTSDIYGLEKEYVHAEALALIRARGRGHRLTVVRVDNMGSPSISTPCKICQHLIDESEQIKEVVHT